MSIAYTYKVQNIEDNTMAEVLVIADSEAEAENKLISEHKKHGISIDFSLEDEDYYDLVIDKENLNEILEPYSSNTIKIAKIQEDYMYKEFGIIPNQIYHFELKDCTSINGIIMNFDYNTFCVMGVKGMYIIKRSDMDSMYPSKISKDKWEESRVKYLESFIKTI